MLPSWHRAFPFVDILYHSVSVGCCWLHGGCLGRRSLVIPYAQSSKTRKSESGVCKQSRIDLDTMTSQNSGQGKLQIIPKVSRMWAKPFCSAHSGLMSSRIVGSTAFFGPIRMKKPGFGDQRRAWPLLIGTRPARPNLYPRRRAPTMRCRPAADRNDGWQSRRFLNMRSDRTAGRRIVKVNLVTLTDIPILPGP